MHCEEINPKQPLHTTFPQRSTGAELFSTCLIVVKNLFHEMFGKLKLAINLRIGVVC